MKQINKWITWFLPGANEIFPYFTTRYACLLVLGNTFYYSTGEYFIIKKRISGCMTNQSITSNCVLYYRINVYMYSCAYVWTHMRYIKLTVRCFTQFKKKNLKRFFKVHTALYCLYRQYAICNSLENLAFK